LTASADSEAVLSPDSDLQPNTLPYNWKIYLATSRLWHKRIANRALLVTFSANPAQWAWTRRNFNRTVDCPWRGLMRLLLALVKMYSFACIAENRLKNPCCRILARWTQRIRRTWRPLAFSIHLACPPCSNIFNARCLYEELCQSKQSPQLNHTNYFCSQVRWWSASNVVWTKYNSKWNNPFFIENILWQFWWLLKI
jgi:hypothetical protein